MFERLTPKKRRKKSVPERIVERLTAIVGGGTKKTKGKARAAGAKTKANTKAASSKAGASTRAAGSKAKAPAKRTRSRTTARKTARAAR